MKHMVLVLVFLLAGCTSSIDVPENQYAVLFRFGEIQSSTPGPAIIDKTVFIEHVVLIDKLFELKVDEGRYVVRYEVTDPERYYKVTGGNRAISGILETELERLSLQGTAIHTQSQLHEVIDDMELPIHIVGRPNQAVNGTPTTLRSVAAHYR
ncbi:MULTISPECIES: hypothetical protein [Marinobacter]|uniref:hypothetical protein n=1 Tax=Marinobacter TaxID=2742 RepID=UPI003267822C